MADLIDLKVRPLTAQRWHDFETLFGPRGACAGCWCIFWKLSAQDFDAGRYARNKAAQKSIVAAGEVPGLLAYLGHQAVGWIAVQPRASYPRLGRSRLLKPADGRAEWSITCFFVRRDVRGRGVSGALVKAAVAHVAKLGGKIVEAYPVDALKGRLPAVSAYTGLAASFRKLGLQEVARNAPGRPILRLTTGD